MYMDNLYIEGKGRSFYVCADMVTRDGEKDCACDHILFCVAEYDNIHDAMDASDGWPANLFTTTTKTTIPIHTIYNKDNEDKYTAQNG